MKTFVYKPGPTLPQLSTQEINGKRHYILPDGSKVVSVTTMLSYFKADSLKNWQARVREEQAERIKVQASLRGEKFHTLMEWYLNNQPCPMKEAVPHLMPDMEQAFDDVRPILDRIDNIRYIEAPLHSVKLKLAGRTDVIADFDGVLSVIDFKTSRRWKKKAWIQDYFHQATIYALMHYELTKVPIKQFVIIISVDGEPEPQVFIGRVRDYLEAVAAKITQYHKDHA